MYINLCCLLKTQKITVDEEKDLNLRGQRKQKNKWQRKNDAHKFCKMEIGSE